MKVLFYLLLFCSLNAAAQSYKVEYATKLSSRLDYWNAYPVWNEIATKTLKKNTGEWDHLRMASEAARKSERYNEAFYWDSVLVANKVANQRDYSNYFEVACLTKKYSLLQAGIESAQVQYPEDPEIKMWASNSSQIMSRYSAGSDYTARQITLDKKGEEFSAYPYKKGLLYVSNADDYGFVNRDYKRTGQHFTNLCFYDSSAQKPGFFSKAFWTKVFHRNQWREIKQTKPHDGPVAFSSDYKTAFVTRNQLVEDPINRIKYARLELKIYELTGDKWEEQDFPFNSTTFSTGHGVVDANGWLIFASDRPGGLGGVDLYKTKFENNKWTEPVNLGATINTAKDEIFPFIDSKGILYFSSNGWPGAGGLDIFYSESIADEPKHIGNPVNTNADDFAYYMNEKTGLGYLSSNRNNWKDQVYVITKPVSNIEQIITLETCDGKALENQTVHVKNIESGTERSFVTNDKGKTSPISMEKRKDYLFEFKGNETYKPLQIKIAQNEDGSYEKAMTLNYLKPVYCLVVQNENGQAIEGAMMTIFKSGGVQVKQLTTSNGSFTYTKEEKAMIDSIRISLINHKDVTHVPTKDDDTCGDTIKVTTAMIKMNDDQFIQLDRVLYNFDKYVLRPEGKTELDKLVQYMKSHPELRVELSSHTDSRGTNRYNLRLSNNRSKSCVRYIISQGISPKMIVAKGYGESKLVNNCADDVPCPDELHQLNRRTELKLINPMNESLDNDSLR